MFLPKVDYCTHVYLQEIMIEQRPSLAKKEVPRVTVPPLPELGVKSLWPLAKEIPGFLAYCPDDWDES